MLLITFFNILSASTTDTFEEILENDSLSTEEKSNKVLKIVKLLPENKTFDLAETLERNYIVIYNKLSFDAMMEILSTFVFEYYVAIKSPKLNRCVSYWIMSFIFDQFDGTKTDNEINKNLNIVNDKIISNEIQCKQGILKSAFSVVNVEHGLNIENEFSSFLKAFSSEGVFYSKTLMCLSVGNKETKAFILDILVNTQKLFFRPEIALKIYKEHQNFLLSNISLVNNIHSMLNESVYLYKTLKESLETFSSFMEKLRSELNLNPQEDTNFYYLNLFPPTLEIKRNLKKATKKPKKNIFENIKEKNKKNNKRPLKREVEFNN